MTAYLAALKMLARRELSEAQVRQRLARGGYQPDEIDLAVARLRDERAIDDARAAEAIARTQTAVRGRGKLRVQREIQAAGVGRAEAQRAVDEVFRDIDSDALLEAALARRLRGRERIADDREFQRLFRYLASQGFHADKILNALNRRRRESS